MDERGFRVIMKHYYLLKDKTAQETKSKLDKCYGESSSSVRTIYKWFDYFCNFHMTTIDTERSKWPLEVTTTENIEKIHDIVMEDR